MPIIARALQAAKTPYFHRGKCSSLQVLSIFMSSISLALTSLSDETSCIKYIIMKKIISFLLVLILISLSGCNQLNDTIKCIDDYIQSLKPKLNSTIFAILEKAFPNTMSTTVQHFDLTPGSQATYIITGDIEAMWLRDSTNQFIPYIRMTNQCKYIKGLTRGLINTQSQFIRIDSYTNAFKKFENEGSKRPSYLNDISESLIMGIPVDLCRKKQYATKSIWERKFQIDSPASYLRLVHEYYQRFNSTDFIDISFFSSLTRILTLLSEQSKDSKYEESIGKNYYTFYRSSEELQNGKIKPSSVTGMIKTGFRPSDSPNELPYNVPGNAFMASYLKLVAEDILNRIPSTSVYYKRAQQTSKAMLEFSEQIKTGIAKFGLISKGGKQMFAYEVDGAGNYRLYDDSNLPSLLSLAYLRFVPLNDEIYQNTRHFILSSKNRFFYSRGDINGVGSSHTSPRYVWPLALITQIMTSTSNAEIKNCLESLIKSAKGNLMHESFWVDNPTEITRDWFAWANSFFGEMIMHLLAEKPTLVGPDD